MKKLFYFTIFFLFFGIISVAFGFDNNKPIATGEAYYDMATGHKYTKNSETTYAEFSRKGKLLRDDVLNTQPHLATSKYITEIGQDHFLVYKKQKNGRVVQQILPFSSKHPEGWQCQRIVSAVKKPYRSEQVGYGYTKAKE